MQWKLFINFSVPFQIYRSPKNGWYTYLHVNMRNWSVREIGKRFLSYSIFFATYGMWLIVEILFSHTSLHWERVENDTVASFVSPYIYFGCRTAGTEACNMSHITVPTESASIYGFHMIFNLNLCTFNRLLCVRSSSRWFYFKCNFHGFSCICFSTSFPQSTIDEAR